MRKKIQVINTSEENLLYPVFLKLDKFETLIVGGGSACLEKLTFLLKSSPNANVSVVSPALNFEIEKLVMDFPRVKLILKKFSPDDLRSKQLVIIATDDAELNSSIHSECKKRGILSNVCDTPELCDFYLGSVVTKGNLKIAISTNGKSPSFAKKFRIVLEDFLPQELPSLLTNLEKIRKNLKGNFAEKVKYLNHLTNQLVNSGN